MLLRTGAFQMAFCWRVSHAALSDSNESILTSYWFSEAGGTSKQERLGKLLIIEEPRMVAHV